MIILYKLQTTSSFQMLGYKSFNRCSSSLALFVFCGRLNIKINEYPSVDLEQDVIGPETPFLFLGGRKQEMC